MTDPSRGVVLLLTLLAAALPAWPGAEIPVLAPLLERVDRRPVVVVPGVTGGMLREIDSGEVIWGLGSNLLRPHDGGYALARPLSTDATGNSGVEAFGVIEQMRLFGVIRKPIYGPVVRLLEANGYRRGDLAQPRPEENFFLFPYDWRDDLTNSAALLVERLERLRRARGETALEVDLICQSAGAQICRYVAKYGGAPLDAAERGEAGPLPTVRIAKIIMVGTSNGGSLRNLREIHRGRTYVPGVGRRMRPEVLFTFAALFQDLPVYRDDLFVDPEGRDLKIDLFDSRNWTRYGWSVFGDESRRRLDESDRADLFGDNGQRLAALDRFLDSGRRLHDVLRRDVGGFATRYYSIQNVTDETPDRAVLLPADDSGWELLFTGDDKLRRMGTLYESVTAYGDGHATQASQRWLSSQESEAMAAAPLHVRGDHFAMILEPVAMARILEYLNDEPGPVPGGCRGDVSVDQPGECASD